MWDNYYKRSKPKAVTDGIKTKKTRGQIGESWWSQRFIKVLESFDIGARLSRGRTYARKGQVMSLEITSGLVTAKVQGSASRPYKITITVKPLTKPQWGQVEARMAEQALFMAKLLAGEMPPDIEKAFETAQLSLFPATVRDLKTECSCPDWSNPCKHIAAVYYILADKFDEDPFLIFEWRGRNKEDLIENLRLLRGTEVDTSENETPNDLVIAPPVIPLEQCLENFWQADKRLTQLKLHPETSTIPDALLRQLNPLDATIGNKKLSEVLTSLYQQFTVKAYEKALGDIHKQP